MFDLFCFLIIKHSNKTIKYLFLIFRGHKDKIFVIKWNPFEHNKLVTVGVKHIKFWTQTGIYKTTLHVQCKPESVSENVTNM